jgi:type III secretion system FlhB-like substrate exporter
VPEIIAYGFGDARHPELGPFIITTFIHGISLTDWWKDRSAVGTQLKLDIDESIVRKVYRQVADILLDLTSLKFPKIGTLSMTNVEPSTWGAIEFSPWTITQHEAERNHEIHPRGLCPIF